MFVCFNRSYCIAADQASIVLLLLTVMLVGANIWTSVDHFYFYCLGRKNEAVQMIIDQDNKVVINFVSGYLFGFAVFNKIQASSSVVLSARRTAIHSRM